MPPVCIRVHECSQAIESVGIGEQGHDNGSHREGQWQNGVLQPAAAGHEHGHPDENDHKGGTEILDSDESTDEENDRFFPGRNPLAGKLIQDIDLSGTLPGQEEDEAQLGDLLG